MKRTAPPRFARLLLRLTPLGSKRSEVKSDLLELLEQRTARQGRRYAARRYYGDVLSLWRRPLWPAAMSPTAVTREHEGALRGFTTDIVYAMRLFRRTPAVVLVATVGLGLAIGVSAAVLTVLNAIVWRPTGVDDPSSSVRVMRTHENGIGTTWSYAEFLQLRERAPQVSLDAWLREDVALSTTARGRVAVNDLGAVRDRMVLSRP